ncbi:PREDICTED: uncharacterized protein LOC105567890 [Vollenhovia emeryi]|uniref:uncharacterized protein LOC105567890 n=1 Tax=Vollenhovia emeryi TaxID=411798 RepID=UPI0005F3EFFB|nr:PREDICTED: uncharacterized protein LOC105567890 [Vollenhovia emeryi]XP_011878530.1 PREDICTED: uncharacterized protein LOC105567890 [Vollenhovia emeryi]
MAQFADLSLYQYMKDDTIFNKINTTFIKMDSDVITHQNPILQTILDELITAMKMQSPLFAKTFQKISWVGSFYKGTRVGEPGEYDIDIVINLPFKERDIQFTKDRPGCIKMCTVWRDINPQKALNLDPKVSKELKSFIDDESYLNQEKFRNWMEGVLNKVAYATSGCSIIKLPGREPIKMKKSGPAFTLTVNYDWKTIDIDVVPALSFSVCSLPRCPKTDILQSCPDRKWFAIPKPFNDSEHGSYDFQYRYWRLSFYEFEKDIFSTHEYGRMKPVIRHLKKFRDTRNWTSIASYYLETLCYHERELFRISHNLSYTFLFYKMLEKLRDAFRDHRIRHYWDDDLNLLEKIGYHEMQNMEGRIQNILENIGRTIQTDRYAMAKYTLNSTELNILVIYDAATIISNMFWPEVPEPELESESESNASKCMIQ